MSQHIGVNQPDEEQGSVVQDYLVIVKNYYDISFLSFTDKDDSTRGQSSKHDKQKRKQMDDIDASDSLESTSEDDLKSIPNEDEVDATEDKSKHKKKSTNTFALFFK